MIKPHDIPTGSDPRPESGRAVERDELGAYLAAVARDDCYRVVRPLGAAARMGADSSVTSPRGPITELVQFEGANGAALGPFVRKRIDFALGVGTAYQELYEAQCSGARFARVPRIVECYKTGRELVVVSEFIPGKTLDAFVNEAGPSLELSLSVVPAVCAAVAELHKAFDPPVVHRDLSRRTSSCPRVHQGFPRRSSTSASHGGIAREQLRIPFDSARDRMLRPNSMALGRRACGATSMRSA